LRGKETNTALPSLILEQGRPGSYRERDQVTETSEIIASGGQVNHMVEARIVWTTNLTGAF